MAQAGHIPLSAVLERLPSLIADGNPRVVDAAVRVASHVADHPAVAATRDGWTRWVRKTFARRARALGLVSRARDDEDTRLLRPNLVALVARETGDDRLVREAKRLAERWLADRKAVEPEVVESILGIAGRHADEALWRRLRDQAVGNPDRRDRGRLLHALASTPDPVLVEKNLSLVLGDDFSLREASALLRGAMKHDETRELAWTWLKTHFDAVLARTPRFFARALPSLARHFCDEAHRKEAEAFFQPRVARVPGGPRTLAEALERVTLCMAQAEAHSDALTRFLQRQ